jgi:hypothetical protein
MATNLNALLGGGGGGAGWKPESQNVISFAANTTGLKANITAPSGKVIKVLTISSSTTNSSVSPKITVTVNGVNIKVNEWAFGTTTFPGVNGQIRNNWPSLTGADYTFNKSFNEIFATSLQVTVVTAGGGALTDYVVYEIGEFI